MDYQEYQNRINRGTMMFESGEYQKALEIFISLAESDISDLDKSNMCINIAVIYEKMDNVQEALHWYSQAVLHEKPHCRFQAQEYLAVYLKELDRHRDSLRIYESLLASTHITEEDKLRLRKVIDELNRELQKPTYRRPGA